MKQRHALWVAVCTLGRAGIVQHLARRVSHFPEFVQRSRHVA